MDRHRAVYLTMTVVAPIVAAFAFGVVSGYLVASASIEGDMRRQMRDIKAAQVEAIAAGRVCKALADDIKAEGK